MSKPAASDELRVNVRSLLPVPTDAPTTSPRTLTPVLGQAEPDRAVGPWRGPRLRSAALWWSCGLIVALSWDRAVWLSVSRAGASAYGWLEASADISVIAERAARLGEFSLTSLWQAAVTLIYACGYFFGRMHAWLLLGVVLVFRDWARDADRVRVGLRRGVFVSLVPAAAGLAAETLKLLSRRARPEFDDGHFRFLAPAGSPADPSFWSTSGLGLASSHAAVGVGAALAAGLLLPRWRALLWGLCVVCAGSRVVVGAHFVSDVYVGATLGVISFAGFYAWDRRNNAGAGLGGGWVGGGGAVGA